VRPTARRYPGELTTEDVNDLNSKIGPALDRSVHFDRLWAFFSERGDFVAAVTAGLAAAVCRLAMQDIQTSWNSVRAWTLALEDIDRPLAASEVRTAGISETTEQALDRVVGEIEDQQWLSDQRLLRGSQRFGQHSVSERLRQLRACPEWSNPYGIFRGHPPAGCAILFRTLLVWPIVFAELQVDLTRIETLRHEARRFRRSLLAFDEFVEATSTAGRYLPDVSATDSEAFRDTLDILCAKGARTRYQNEHSDRVALVRQIAGHFRRFLNVTHDEAARTFKVEPWSTGISALASAALNRRVSTEDVRGALKNWSSD
jgi:hypothetical protein